MAEIGRVAILGDVHAEDRFLAGVVGWLSETEINVLFCTGDVVSGSGDGGRCCDLLQSIRALTVRGNHDRWLLEDPELYRRHLSDATPEEQLTGAHLEFLAGLPPTRAFETPRGPLLLCHGTGEDDMTGVYPGDSETALAANFRLQALVGEGYYRVMVAGHTHQRMVRTVHGLTVINPGTLRAHRDPGFLLADFAQGWVQTYHLDPRSAQITEGKRAIL